MRNVLAFVFFSYWIFLAGGSAIAVRALEVRAGNVPAGIAMAATLVILTAMTSRIFGIATLPGVSALLGGIALFLQLTLLFYVELDAPTRSSSVYSIPLQIHESRTKYVRPDVAALYTASAIIFFCSIASSVFYLRDPRKIYKVVDNFRAESKQ